MSTVNTARDVLNEFGETQQGSITSIGVSESRQVGTVRQNELETGSENLDIYGCKVRAMSVEFGLTAVKGI